MDTKRYFQKEALIPAIVQDDESGDVLMLAYMNEESLRKTAETGYTWFYSRSRATLWHKGETSGHVQRVVSIVSDCDDDTLLIRVKQTGAACHTGHRTCFYQEPIFENRSAAPVEQDTSELRKESL
jgi:phosphoribosyl-AMP cyclohydrolase